MNAIKEEHPFLKSITLKSVISDKRLYKGLIFILLSQLILALSLISSNYPKQSWIFTVVTIIATIFCIKWANNIIKKDKYDTYDYGVPPFDKKWYIISLILLILYFFVSPILTNLLGAHSVSQENQNFLNTLIKNSPVSMFICISILAPFCEELTFRLLWPKAFGNSILAYIIMTFVFVSLHSPTGLSGWVSYGLLGAILLYVRLKSDNIYNSIATHMTWNTVSFILSLIILHK